MKIINALWQAIIKLFAFIFSKNKAGYTDTKPTHLMNTIAPAASLQLTISPTTVYYNAGQGVKDTVDFIMTIANTGTDSVQIARAAILLPSNLYAAGSLGTIVPVAPSSVWNFTAADTPGAFAASPAKSPAITLNAGSSISFSLQSITIAASALTTQVTMRVKLSDGTSVEQTPSINLEPGLPGINLFFSEPANINPGQTSTLNWETTGMDYCMIAPGNIRVEASGSLDLSPESTTTYTLTAYTAGTQVTQQTTISVGLPSIIQFGIDGSSTEVDYNSSITLIWECSPYTQSIQLTSDNYDLTMPTNLSPGPGQVTTVIKNIKKNTTFQLTPYGYGEISYNSQPLSITINPPTATFTATPDTNVWEKDTVTLSWSITNAASVSVVPPLPGGPSLQTPAGSLVIHPTENVSYALTVTGAEGTTPATGSVSFNVQQVAITSFVTTQGLPIIPDNDPNEVTFQWAVQGQVASINPVIGTVGASGTQQINTPASGTYTISAGTNQNPALASQSIDVLNCYGPYQFNAFTAEGGWPNAYGFTVTNPAGLINLKDLFTGGYSLQITGVTATGIPDGCALYGFANPDVPTMFFITLFPVVPELPTFQFAWSNPAVQQGTITITGLAGR